MSKTQHPRPANSGSNVARGMILSGAYKNAGPMTNRNEKRQGSRRQQEQRAIREHAE